MSVPYCGINEPRKGQHRGSMKECALANQVRLYGIYKADPRLIAFAKAKNNTAANKQELKLELAKLLGNRRKLLKELEGTKDKKKVKKLQDEIRGVQEKALKVQTKLTGLVK